MSFYDVLPTDEDILEQEAFLEGIDETWKDRALCRGLAVPGEPNPFFPERHDAAQIADVKKFCAPCPVKEDCLEYALAWKETHGMWGGVGGATRRKLSRQRHALVRTEAA